MHSTLSSRVDFTFAENLISAEDWDIVWNDALNTYKEIKTSKIQEVLNADGEEAALVTKRVAIKRRVLDDIETLLADSLQHVSIEARRVYEWASRAYKFTHTAVEGSALKTCVFTHKTEAVMVEAQFSVYNAETSEIITSPLFLFTSEFGTVVRSWNLLFKFDSFLTRLVHNYIEAEGETEKEKQFMNARSLPRSLNAVARFLFNFMHFTHAQTQTCTHTLLEFAS